VQGFFFQHIPVVLLLDKSLDSSCSHSALLELSHDSINIKDSSAFAFEGEPWRSGKAAAL